MRTDGVASQYVKNIDGFELLVGEEIVRRETTADGGIVLCTNYQIILHYSDEPKRQQRSCPLTAIEYTEVRNLYSLHLHSKLAYSLVVSFANGEQCADWSRLITDEISKQGKSLAAAFSVSFCTSTSQLPLLDGDLSDSIETIQKSARRSSSDCLSREIKRLELNSDNWRIFDINRQYRYCSSYPELLILPKTFQDGTEVTEEFLDKVAEFRFSRRIPTAVWRHPTNQCIIARSSQPAMGWLGWRSKEDEKLLEAFVASCNSSNKLLVLDARSYPAAVANRAKGGGVECTEYYPSCEIQFMGLANIHYIRRSFNALRCLNDLSEEATALWHNVINGSKWLDYISAIVKSALIAVNAVDAEARPVLVHCSDGWDRTPQIVSLAELLLDPHYRTIDGFQTLINREWIEFGHKFGDRTGILPTNDDPNERCPVFLQWLDCVHQIVKQFPDHFEFNLQYLILLARHTNSALFGTFLFNNMLERSTHKINDSTHSVWAYLNLFRDQYLNNSYKRTDEVLKPNCDVKDIRFWQEVYCPYREHKLPPPPVTAPASNGGILLAIHDKLITVKAVTSQLSDLALVDSHAPENGEQQNGNSNLVESVKKEEEKCCS